MLQKTKAKAGRKVENGTFAQPYYDTSRFVIFEPHNINMLFSFFNHFTSTVLSCFSISLTSFYLLPLWQMLNGSDGLMGLFRGLRTIDGGPKFGELGPDPPRFTHSDKWALTDKSLWIDVLLSNTNSSVDVCIQSFNCRIYLSSWYPVNKDPSTAPSTTQFVSRQYTAFDTKDWTYRINYPRFQKS